MSIPYRAQRVLLVAAVCFVAVASAHAGDQFPRPGSFAAIESVKDPAHYGPHLTAAKATTPSAAAGPGCQTPAAAAG